MAKRKKPDGARQEQVTRPTAGLPAWQLPWPVWPGDPPDAVFPALPVGEMAALFAAWRFDLPDEEAIRIYFSGETWPDPRPIPEAAVLADWLEEHGMGDMAVLLCHWSACRPAVRYRRLVEYDSWPRGLIVWLSSMATWSTAEGKGRLLPVYPGWQTPAARARAWRRLESYLSKRRRSPR